MAAKGQLKIRIVGDHSQLDKSTKGAAGVLGKFGKAAAAAVASGVAFSVKAFADFDQAMTNSVAIMGDVSDAMRKDMSDAAREVAKTTKFSATEAAESYFFLASAGMDAEQAIGTLPKVAAFAQAGNFDMALATDLLTDAQSALGLSVKDTAQNIENLSRVSDVLVKANTLANASVEQFSSALTNKAGAALRSMNKDVEEGVAVLAVLADQGTKGEKAGEALAIVIRDLSEKALANKDAFAKMGVTVFDAKGEMNNLADIVGDLEGALAGMSTEQRIAALSTLGFTGDAQKNILALLGNSEAVRQYEKDLRSAGGTTQDVADKQMNTFWAQLGLLKDQLIDIAIGIGERLVPVLRGMADWVIRNQGTVITLGVVLGGLAAAALAVRGAMMVYNVAMGLVRGATVAMTVAQWALNVAMMANPVGLVIALIVGLIAVIVLLWNNSAAFRQFFIDAWESIKNAVVVAAMFIRNKAVAAWNAIKNAAQVVLGWVETRWNKFKAFVGGIARVIGSRLSSMWDGIKSGARTAINFAIRLLNGAIGAINTLIRGINLIPGVSIPQIPKVGFLEKGGPAAAGQPYIVGERGPELFVPGASGTVVPHHQLQALMAQSEADSRSLLANLTGGASAAMPSASPSASPSGPVRLVVDTTGGDDEFTRWFVRQLRNRVRLDARGSAERFFQARA